MAVRARTIKAKNVGDLQIHGADAETAAELAGLKTHGDVVAEEIEAENVGGVQVFDPSAIDTVDRLRTELAALRQQLEDALGGADTKAAKEVRATLDSAARELDRPQPSGGAVVPKLEKAVEILDKGTRMTEAADKLGKSMAKLVPVAKALWQAAITLFGA